MPKLPYGGEILRSHPDQATRWSNPARNHLNYYVHAHLMWDADQDLDALLDEYYRLFYGPAADVMQAAFEFGEQNYDRTGRRGGLDLPRNVRFVEQVQAALALTGDDVYATRIRRLLDELPALDELRAELQAEQNAGNPRDEAPVVDESVHLLEVFHPRHFARLAFDTPDAGAQP